MKFCEGLAGCPTPDWPRSLGESWICPVCFRLWEAYDPSIDARWAGRDLRPRYGWRGLSREAMKAYQSAEKAAPSAEQHQGVSEDHPTDYVALAARVTTEAALRAVPREDEDDE